MNTFNEPKLDDFISGLSQINNSTVARTSLVIVDEKNRKDVVDFIIKTGMICIEDNTDNKDYHPDMTLKEIVASIKNEKTIVLNFHGEIDAKIIDFLINYSYGFVNVQLTGGIKPIIINPIPQKGYIILVLNKEQYSKIELKNTVSSYCNITG